MTKTKITNAKQPSKTEGKKAVSTRKPTAQTKLQIAEGAVAVATPMLTPSKVTPENVLGFSTNIHIADLMNNLTKQVYSAEPEITVTDEEGNVNDKLTEWGKREFHRLGCWNLMRYVIPDTYHWGAFVYSVGYQQVEGGIEIKEIRHLPGESFTVPPMMSAMNMITPNPLMPGIVVDTDGNVQAWQTDRQTGRSVELHNVQFVRAAGTPYPSGSAYLYPCYFLVARMDFAEQAQMQQVSRVGAPRLIPKVKDDVSTDEYRKLAQWHKTAGKFWNGKDSSILVPPFIEFPTLNIRESTTASDFVAKCVEYIRTYGNPMSDLTSAGGLGQSDSGRMEMWVNFISSEQTLAETWLEDIFNFVLKANGYDNYKVSIKLKRPSIDRSAVKLQAITQLSSAGAITKEEIRNNVDDILELKEWSEELDAELKTSTPASAYSNPYSTLAFANSEVGKTVTNPEEDVMRKTQSEIEAVYNDGMQKILAELDADERTKADN